MNKLAPLFFALLASFGLFAQSGTTCSTAIPLTGTGQCIDNLQSAGVNTWFSFNANSTSLGIDLSSTSLYSADGFTLIQLYSGTCTSLIPVSGAVTWSNTINVQYSGLTSGATYYLKLEKSNAVQVNFDLCISAANLSLSCAAGCPSNPNNASNNTCEAVCNGGFEYNQAPPWGLHCIKQACPWDTSGQKATPDLFNSTVNTTANSSGYKVKTPNNFAGGQQPKSGNGYAGIVTYMTIGNNYKEFLVQPLLTPLQANKKYRVSFYVSLAGHAGYKTLGMGAFLSATNPNSLGYSNLQLQNPQIKGTLFNSTIGDTTNWVLITDTITPTTTMYYIAIGCFKNNANDGHTNVPHTTSQWPSSMVSSGAFYYVDEVSILPEGALQITANPNPVCHGTPTALTASSTIGNGNYAWSVAPFGTYTCSNPPSCSQISSVITAGGGITYSATTTIPGFNNCTVTQSITPQWLAGPNTINAGPDINACPGGTTTLSGAATGYYSQTSWSVVNGPILCSGCTTFTVNPNTTTQYVFTATNTTTGCTLRDTVKINVVPLAVTINTPPGLTTCDGCFNFSTTPSFTTYSWSSNALSASCNTCPTYSACYGSSFNSASAPVSVVVTDAQGCTGSAVTYVPLCCYYITPEGYQMPNVVNDSSSHVNTNWPGLMVWDAANQVYRATNKQFSINGYFVVDKNTIFEGCDVKLGANAKIIVRPGITFNLTKSQTNATTNLYSCTDMWDGIYVDGTNSASLVIVQAGTTINDALNAIVSTNGGNFRIDGSAAKVKFNKNNIAILIKPFNGTHPGVIRAAIIACDAPGQPGSTGGITNVGPNCKAPINGKGLAGVYIENTTLATVGDSTVIGYRNLFERTKYGVYSKNSNVQVWNNEFKYFTTTSLSKNAPPDGIAVYSTATKFTPKTLTVGRQGNYKAKNKFVKSSYGVMAHNYVNLYCEYNRFDSCTSVSIYTLNSTNRTILINRDTLTECTGTNISCVQSNNATVTITYNSMNQTQSFTNNNFGQTGIHVVNAVVSNMNLRIQYNRIRKMRNGIWVSRVNGAKITDNPAIDFLAGQPTSTTNPCIGIKLEEAHNALVRMNVISYPNTPVAANHATIFGVHLTNCVNDTVVKNTLTRMGSGIFLKGANNPCILACNTLTTCYYGINFNYINVNGVGVSINDQINWTAANTPYATGNNWGSGSISFDLKGSIIPINTNGIKWYYPLNGYNPTTSMTGSSLFNSNTVFTTNGDRCLAVMTPPAQSPETVRNNLLSGICLQPRAYDTLSEGYIYHDVVFAYRMLRNNPSWLTLGTPDDAAYQQFYTAVSASNVGVFADAEDLFAADNTGAGLAALNTIVPYGEYQQNRKVLLSVYANTWAVDSMNLDSTQQATLGAIIAQGPLNGGTAVFDARNMLREEWHDSTNLRLAPPASNSNVNTLVAYPNPTSGTCTIAFEITDNNTSVLQVVDISGRPVGTWQLQAGTNLHQIDVSHLPSGTYIYCIIVNGRLVGREKLLVLKE